MDLHDRGQFLNLSGLVEGGLIVVAFLLGWWCDVDPVAHLTFDWPAVLWGAAAALPMFLLFVLSHRAQVESLRRIRRFLHEALGPSLAACRWYDLILLATLAGLAEEVLFRGFLQSWMTERWGYAIGLLGSSVLFGLAHPITPFYALFAGLMGLYLGYLFDGALDEPGLLAPVVTHAVYDYLAFLVVLRTYRREQAQSNGESLGTGGDDAPD